MTQCVRDPVVFRGTGRREVIGRFDGGRMSSDGGALLLRDADKVVGLSARIAACFDDYRDPTRTEHSLEALVRQRVFGLALGYEDLNDHDEIRRDSMLALACGRGDLTGEERARARDRAFPLAGSSTLNRMELGCPDTAAARHPQHRGADLGLGRLAGGLGAARSSASFREFSPERGGGLPQSFPGRRSAESGRPSAQLIPRFCAFDRPKNSARSPSEALSADFPAPADL